MNKPNNELFATLHQLAATVTTVFEVLAESKPDVHQADVPTAPSPEPEPKPTQPPAPERSQDDIRRDPVRWRRAASRAAARAMGGPHG
jgi:hypothetical protein